MLLASEAREQTKNMIHINTTEELKYLEDWIIQHVNCGDYEFSFDGNISPAAKQELERCGYTVEIGSQYNQGWVRISWE